MSEACKLYVKDADVEQILNILLSLNVLYVEYLINGKQRQIYLYNHMLII